MRSRQPRISRVLAGLRGIERAAILDAVEQAAIAPVDAGARQREAFARVDHAVGLRQRRGDDARDPLRRHGGVAAPAPRGSKAARPHHRAVLVGQLQRDARAAVGAALAADARAGRRWARRARLPGNAAAAAPPRPRCRRNAPIASASRARIAARPGADGGKLRRRSDRPAGSGSGERGRAGSGAADAGCAAICCCVVATRVSKRAAGRGGDQDEQGRRDGITAGARIAAGAASPAWRRRAGRALPR